MDVRMGNKRPAKICSKLFFPKYHEQHSKASSLKLLNEFQLNMYNNWDFIQRVCQENFILFHNGKF
jgi:hypothetical protein